MQFPSAAFIQRSISHSGWFSCGISAAVLRIGGLLSGRRNRGKKRICSTTVSFRCLLHFPWASSHTLRGQSIEWPNRDKREPSNADNFLSIYLNRYFFLFFSPTLFSIAVAIVAAPLRPLFNQQERDHCRYSQVRITRRKVCNTFVTDTSFFFTRWWQYITHIW